MCKCVGCSKFFAFTTTIWLDAVDFIFYFLSSFCSRLNAIETHKNRYICRGSERKTRYKKRRFKHFKYEKRNVIIHTYSMLYMQTNKWVHVCVRARASVFMSMSSYIWAVPSSQRHTNFVITIGISQCRKKRSYHFIRMLLFFHSLHSLFIQNAVIYVERWDSLIEQKTVSPKRQGSSWIVGVYRIGYVGIWLGLSGGKFSAFLVS